MATSNLSGAERRTFWQGHLDHWRQSGLTQIEYCRQQHLSIARFGYWKKRLWPAAASPAPAGFVAVQVSSAPAPGGRSAALCVVVDERRRIEVSPGFDPATLRTLIQALSG